MQTTRLFISMLACAAVLFAGCTPKDGGGDPKTCTVTFHSNGGILPIAPVTVEKGKLASEPAEPENKYDEELDFSGWYTDNITFADPFDFSAPVTADVVLYAKWTGIDAQVLSELLYNWYYNSLDEEDYTPQSFIEYTGVWEAIYEFSNYGSPAEAEIVEAYYRLIAAVEALEILPERMPAYIYIANWPGEFIYASPGSFLNITTYAKSADGSNAVEEGVLIEVAPVAWLEEYNIYANGFEFDVADSAPAGAEAAVTITSMMDPGVSRRVAIKVLDLAMATSIFLEAVADLPDPEDVDYDDYIMIEYVLNFRYILYNLGMEEPTEELQVAADKMFDCQDALYALPNRMEFRFSGNTVAVTEIDSYGYRYNHETYAYEQDGSFPCGTYSTEWEESYQGEYEQMRITLGPDNTFAQEYWLADDAAGTNASLNYSTSSGTYTFTGTQASGMMLYVTHDNIILRMSAQQPLRQAWLSDPVRSERSARR